MPEARLLRSRGWKLRDLRAVELLESDKAFLLNLVFFLVLGCFGSLSGRRSMRALRLRTLSPSNTH